MIVSAKVQMLLDQLAASGGRIKIMENDIEEHRATLDNAKSRGLLTYEEDGGYGFGYDVTLTRLGRDFVGLPPRLSDQAKDALLTVWQSLSHRAREALRRPSRHS